MYPLKDVICGRCQHLNPPLSRACEQCGTVFARYVEQKPVKSRWANLGMSTKLGLVIVGVLIITGLLVVAVNKVRTSSEQGRQWAEKQRQLAAAQKETIYSGAMSVKAVDIAMYYTANEVAADQQYKGQMVRVTGRIDTVGKDILNKMYVALEGNPSSIIQVQCFFEDDQHSNLLSLYKGQMISITGRCDGKFMNVILRECLVR